MTFTKPCPQCNEPQTFINKISFERSVNKKLLCKKCSLSRKRTQKQKTKEFFITCVNCDHTSFYSSLQGKIKAEKLNRCKSCTVRKIHKENPERMIGENNPMFGTNLEEVWLNKLGEREARIKSKKLSEKRSIASSGIKNNMYGKSPGTGAGKGISGRYKSVYFRSSYELAFLLEFEKLHNCLPINAESNKFRVRCDINKTCVPDFFHNNHVFEIKPSSLILINQNKIDALKDMCSKNKYIFNIITEKDLKLPKNIKNWIKDLYDQDVIQFSEKQYLRFLKIK